MSTEALLADIKESLEHWEDRFDFLLNQIAALREENAELKAQLTAKDSPRSKWLTPDEAYPLLQHASRKALYEAIDNGLYKSGTEVQRRGKRNLVINVEAIEARFTREQTKKRVC